MIIVLFGQPHSGKTTLAKELMYELWGYHIDGDELRSLFKNNDYSKEGRIKNLNRASDIAHYVHESIGDTVVLSLVYPYKETRDYLNSLTEDIKWIYLHYSGERGREGNHVKDFEFPFLSENVLQIDTSAVSIEDSINKIKLYVG